MTRIKRFSIAGAILLALSIFLQSGTFHEAKASEISNKVKLSLCDAKDVHKEKETPCIAPPSAKNLKRLEPAGPEKIGTLILGGWDCYTVYQPSYTASAFQVNLYAQNAITDQDAYLFDMNWRPAPGYKIQSIAGRPRNTSDVADWLQWNKSSIPTVQYCIHGYEAGSYRVTFQGILVGPA